MKRTLVRDGGQPSRMEATMAPLGGHINLAVGVAVLATLMVLAVLVVALDIEIALPRG